MVTEKNAGKDYVIFLTLKIKYVKVVTFANQVIQTDLPEESPPDSPARKEDEDGEEEGDFLRLIQGQRGHSLTPPNG